MPPHDPAPTFEVRLRIERLEPLTGDIGPPAGPLEPFTGWIGLGAAIARHYREGPTPPGKERSMVELKLELVPIPVTDVDRAKAFYTEKAGFNADHDHQVSDEVRFVQLTPPGSACSIAIGTGLMESPPAPGSAQGLTLVVSDIHAARAELAERGVDVTEVQEFPWGSFVFFRDPDGNGWSVQGIPPRD